MVAFWTKKKDYDSEDIQIPAPGQKKSQSKTKTLSLGKHKKDYFDEEISELRYAAINPCIQTPSRNEGLRIRSPVNKKSKLNITI